MKLLAKILCLLVAFFATALILVDRSRFLAFPFQKQPSVQKQLPDESNEILSNLESDMPLIRREALSKIDELSLLRSDIADAVFRHSIEDSSSRVRIDALRLLCKHGPGSIRASRALKLFMDDADSINRVEALVLGLHLDNNNSELQLALVALFDSEPSFVRGSICLSVSELSPLPPCLLNLVIRGLSDPDSGTRMTAAHALGNIGSAPPTHCLSSSSC